MREIKFRAWNIGTKKMVDLHKITPLALSQGMTGDGLYLPFKDEWPLMQFTGQKDLNGVDIYEGDVLDGHSDGLVKVEWNDHNCDWECVFDKDGNSVGLSELCTWFGNNAIVKGNIYQNPELLPL